MTTAFKIIEEKILEVRSTRSGVLNLRGLGLTTIPEKVYSIEYLRVLDLSYNNLIINEIAFDKLSNLQELYLSSNNISSLPPTFRKLEKLKILNLSNNLLSDLPEWICDIFYLRELNISNNHLRKLPINIGNLSNIQSINAQGNYLSELPEDIIRNTELQELILSYNSIKNIPSEIRILSKLRILDMQHNILKTLPLSMLDMKNLNELYLHGNSDLNIIAEVLGPIREEITTRKVLPIKPNIIINYHLNNLKGSHPLNEAKLILVGRGGVGKTSIVNRILFNNFNNNESKTNGINISEWNIRIAKNDTVRLNIWDFGGQDIMHATHQFFMTKRSIYLLLLNGREGFEDSDAEYWLKLIESFGGDSPIIVVLNKIKEHSFDVNRAMLIEKYPAIKKFVETDCELNIGIDDLKNTVKNTVANISNIKDPFPMNWFAIKNRLANLKENYITFDKYKEVCSEHGEPDENAQILLAGYLHDLGIILNFNNDARLRDTHVLNPHWVTNGIYKILNSEKLQKQKGEIWLSDLREILENDVYPSNMWLFIFDLMKKFELCFSFYDQDTHFLIPELLDKQQPKAASDYKPELCINFQYKYSIIPEGLLPRFIVRTNSLSEGLYRWRTGVILRFEDNHALVRADLHERNVNIYVSGPKSGAKNLLAVIRSEFEMIHKDIKKLPVESMVPIGNYDISISYKKLQAYEGKNISEIIEVQGEETFQVKVSELLNNVDLSEERNNEINNTNMPINVFISYTHSDEQLMQKLETHLKILQRKKLLESWYDRKLLPGDEVDYVISENLRKSRIILLLVSAEFISSKYCYEIELKKALEMHKNGIARVIPIILRNVNWHDTPFSHLLALPTDGKPVTLWPNRDSAWRNVADNIEEIIKKMKNELNETNY